jgi:hypothetical protein
MGYDFQILGKIIILRIKLPYKNFLMSVKVVIYTQILKVTQYTDNARVDFHHH